MIRQMLKNRTMQVISLFLVILAIVILITMLVGCDRKKPIKVGFVGDLTGHVSDLGIAGGNGVILAIEEVNKAGGIHGRPIELITRDDQHFVVTYGYEAAIILCEVLSKNDDPETLKEHIIKQGIFHGLEGEITIDQYGDARRKNYLITFRDGQFVIME
jgi:ABC-type branched-subunit amino acid transport system substrate-binding protein